jgi:hypothetical protein
MRIDTALTMFSVTTLGLIVALVMMTAVQTGITKPVIVGSYYAGIPVMGVNTRETIPLTMAEADPGSRTCYWDGIEECAKANAGSNFVKCSNSVAMQCGLPALATCTLPAGFELKYTNSRDCNYGAMDECKQKCSAGTVYDCVRLSQPRCSLIGGYFQSDYLQGKFTSYGELQ